MQTTTNTNQLKPINTDTSSITDRPLRYDIIDSHTNRVVGTAKTSANAHNRADRMDNNYGAVRYTVKTIWPVFDYRPTTLP